MLKFAIESEVTIVTGDGRDSSLYFLFTFIVTHFLNVFFFCFCLFVLFLLLLALGCLRFSLSIMPLKVKKGKKKKTR